MYGISKRCYTQKRLSSKNEGTLDTRPLVPREAALVAGISSMAKNVMKGNMKEVLGSHKQLVAFTKSGNTSSGVSDPGSH